MIHKTTSGCWLGIIQWYLINIWMISRLYVKFRISVKEVGREGLKEVHQKFTLIGERRTHTHRQDRAPPHIPKQHTHCVTAPFVFHFHPLSCPISPSCSHISPLIPILVLTFVTHPPLSLCFLAFAAVPYCL